VDACGLFLGSQGPARSGVVACRSASPPPAGCARTKDGDAAYSGSRPLQRLDCHLTELDHARAVLQREWPFGEQAVAEFRRLLCTMPRGQATYPHRGMRCACLLTFEVSGRGGRRPMSPQAGTAHRQCGGRQKRVERALSGQVGAPLLTRRCSGIGMRMVSVSTSRLARPVTTPRPPVRVRTRPEQATPGLPTRRGGFESRRHAT